MGETGDRTQRPRHSSACPATPTKLQLGPMFSEIQRFWAYYQSKSHGFFFWGSNQFVTIFLTMNPSIRGLWCNLFAAGVFMTPLKVMLLSLSHQGFLWAQQVGHQERCLVAMPTSERAEPNLWSCCKDTTRGHLLEHISMGYSPWTPTSQSHFRRSATK